MSWSSLGSGSYHYRDGNLSAVVLQKDELWESAVYFKGRMTDFGIWDGRETAFRNAKSAMKRTEALLFPIDRLNTGPKDNDDDDDD